MATPDQGRWKLIWWADTTVWNNSHTHIHTHTHNIFTYNERAVIYVRTLQRVRLQKELACQRISVFTSQRRHVFPSKNLSFVFILENPGHLSYLPLQIAPPLLDKIINYPTYISSRDCFFFSFVSFLENIFTFSNLEHSKFSETPKHC